MYFARFTLPLHNKYGKEALKRNGSNYTYLYNNLSPETKKYTNMYRALSPIVIKTFGGNNFIYERKYKSNSNNDIMDSEYDYIEKE